METSGDQLDIKTTRRSPDGVRPNFGRANHPMIIISYDVNVYKIDFFNRTFIYSGHMDTNEK